LSFFSNISDQPLPPVALPRFFQARGIYYGWVIVACVLLTTFYALGFRYAFGVYYAAMLEETGWSRADTAVVFSLAMGVYALTALPAGWLFDRIGPRRLFVGGATLLGTGLMLCSLAANVPALLGSYGVIVGLSYAALGFIPHAAVVPRWFMRRRGMALAVALSGVGFGSLGMSWISALLIEAYGWRLTMLGCGFGAWFFLIPLNALVHQPNPQALGLFPDGASRLPHEPGRRIAQRVPISVALRMPAFWMLFASVTMVGLVGMTMAVHQPRLVIDLGFSLGFSAFLFGSLGLLRTIGNLILGPLSDRYGRTLCVWLVTGASVLGFGALILCAYLPADWHTTRLTLLWGFTLTFGIGYNGITPLYASAVAEHFSGPSLGTLFGMLDFGFGLGAALGPWLAGKIYDMTGSYESALWGLTLAVFVTGVCLLAGGKHVPDSAEPE
jgi:MFS family permease